MSCFNSIICKCTHYLPYLVWRVCVNQNNNAISAYIQVHKTSFITNHIDNQLTETFKYNIPDILSNLTNKKLIYIIIHGNSYKEWHNQNWTANHNTLNDDVANSVFYTCKYLPKNVIKRRFLKLGRAGTVTRCLLTNVSLSKIKLP